MTSTPLRVAPLIALVLALAACAGVLETPPAHAAPIASAWPPRWHEGMPNDPSDFGVPRFTAPMASHCRRAPSTHEVKGGGREPGISAGRRGHHAASIEALGSALIEGRADAAPGTAPVGESAARRASAEARDESAAPEAERPGEHADASGRTGATADMAAAPHQALAPSPRPHPAAPRQRPAHPTVTAGMVDDNADFGAYLAYRRRHAGLPVREREVSERYRLEVTDAHGRPVHDAEVALQRPGVAEPVMWARTDTGGRVWLHPRAFMAGGMNDVRALGVAVRKHGTMARGVLRQGQSNAVQVRLATDDAVQRPRLDLVFMVDATGSMGDEIAKLKTSMHAIAQQIARLPGTPDICYGLVAYRDRGDAFITRTHDFVDDLGDFQRMLARLHAAGGGDTPEALNEALHEVVHNLSWRADAARMVVLVADARPHLDYGGPQYDVDMQAALAKGIKLFAVGASGLDAVGEYVFRQLAQYTAGRFVFLTYRTAGDPGSGAGTQTVHDVAQYSVQTLDELVVRLVSDEMARLNRS
jgi:Mg-chelatase subunit ChlD